MFSFCWLHRRPSVRMCRVCTFTSGIFVYGKSKLEIYYTSHCTIFLTVSSKLLLVEVCFQATKYKYISETPSSL